MSGSIFLKSSEISVSEKDGTVLVTIVREGDLSQPVSIMYEITPASANDATAGLDYTASQLLGTLLLPAGATQVSLPITIIDDALSEPTEAFVVSLISVSSGELLAPRTARVDILDDENPVAEMPEPPLQSDYEITKDVVISGLNQPINFDFSPVDSSLIYIAEKGGKIKVYDLDTKSYVSTFIDLTAEVNNKQDRGLMDIAIHPDFPNHPYIYAFYVVDPPDTAGKTGNAGPDGEGNRFAYLVRFEADPATNYTTIKQGPDARVVLLGGAGQSLSDISGGGAVDSTLPSTVNTTPASDIDPDTGNYIQDYIKVDARSHAGGALAFGPDGNLYVSIGDGTSFNFADPRTFSVQSLDSLSGKILRIDPLTGDGLADNPFIQSGMDLDSNRAKVYQLGLRNPFSMGFDSDGRLFITETGWNSYEEINTGGPGANFGWPFYEGGDLGELKTNNYKNFPQAQAFFDAVANGTIKITPAYRAFSHATEDPGYQIQAITGGGVIYTGSKYPVEFQNDYFFNDFSQGEIYSIDVNDRRDVKYLFNTDSGLGYAHFLQGPDGYIYMADLVTGTIRRLEIDYKLVAKADAAVTPVGTAVNINALTNDLHPMGEQISLTSVSTPAHGTAVINNNGTPNDPTDDFIRYTPSSGFVGIDTFNYVVKSGTITSTGQISVAVGNVVADDNFETVTPGWSSGSRITVLDTSNKQTLALGRFGAGNFVEKTFDIPANVGHAVISFDFYEIDSWDSSQKDSFFVTINGQRVLLEGFSSARGAAGNDAPSSGVSGNVAWSITPLTDNSINRGGTINDKPWFNDQIHRVTLDITNPGQIIKLGLGSTLNQNIVDESFAIDNFKLITGGQGTGPVSSTAATETFETGAFGWSSAARIDVLDADGDHTMALGRFGAGTVVQKTFTNALGVDNVVFSFDLYELDSWDSNQNDSFFVTINGQRVLLEGFSSARGAAGNDAPSGGASGNVTWSITPLTDNSANLGGTAGNKPWFNDQIHRVTIDIKDPGQLLKVGLGSTLNQSIADESFAIDNFTVSSGKHADTATIKETFETAPQGWSSASRISVLNADGQTTKALGAFGKGEVQKTFLVTAGATSVAVSFDLYELDSWDGDKGDAFYVKINGRQVLLEDFFSGRGQAGNDPASSGVSGDVTWSITPLTDNSANLGGTAGNKPWFNDQIHRVTLDIKNPGDALHIGLGSTLNQSIADESFAIDNFELTVFSGDQHLT